MHEQSLETISNFGLNEEEIEDIFDIIEMEMKTGIAHQALTPTLGMLDPNALMSLPRPVIASNAFDVFSHAIESLTAKPYTERIAPKTPDKRPLLQGANPYSNVSCKEAIRLIPPKIANDLPRLVIGILSVIKACRDSAHKAVPTPLKSCKNTR